MTVPAIAVVGGSGALGRAIVAHFARQKWTTLSIDRNVNTDADESVVVQGDAEADGTILSNLIDQTNEGRIGRSGGLRAVVSAAGGWAGGNAASPGLLETLDAVFKHSVQSSVFAAHLAARSLAPHGLLVLSGAAPAAGPTPTMIAYGLAKASVHQLTRSLAAEGSGLPDGACATCIAPNTLDTPGNRAAMPDADKSVWTPTDAVAGQIFKWSVDEAARPRSGSLVELITKDGDTQFREIC